jgi:hypothetical protein
MLAGAVYALAYSVPTTPCPSHGTCDVAAPHHPYVPLAIGLALGGIAVLAATGFAAHISNVRRWRKEWRNTGA